MELNNISRAGWLFAITAVLIIAGIMIEDHSMTGRAIQESAECQDPDGLDLSQKTSVRFSLGTAEDECRDSSTLREYYCLNNELRAGDFECPQGMECNEGECVKIRAECTDTDGKNHYTRGSTSTSEYGFIDECIDSHNLLEYYCKEGQVEREIFYCSQGCYDSVCSGTAEAGCTDSDQGQDKFVRGMVELGSILRVDECLDENTLLEYYCHENTYRQEKYGCAEGCIEGECKRLEGANDALFYLEFDDGMSASIAAGENNVLERRGVTFDDGKSGEGVLVDRTDRLKYDAEANIDIRKGSISFWYKNIDERDTRTLFSAYNSDNDLLEIKQEGQWILVYSRDQVLEGFTKIKPGEWHKLKFSWGDGMQLYLDEELLDSNEYSGKALGAQPKYLWIGLSGAKGGMEQSGAVFDRLMIR